MLHFFRHPLFPLLALLFEKCELATQSSECPSTESFNLDIQAFVQHQGREGKPFFTDNHDVNDLVSLNIKKISRKKFRKFYLSAVLCIPYFCRLVFWSLQLRDFLSVFFGVAHLALQNVNHDYAIFLYFPNFVTKSDQKPNRKNGMKERNIKASKKKISSLAICSAKILIITLNSK